MVLMQTFLYSVDSMLSKALTTFHRRRCRLLRLAGLHNGPTDGPVYSLYREPGGGFQYGAREVSWIPKLQVRYQFAVLIYKKRSADPKQEANE